MSWFPLWGRSSPGSSSPSGPSASVPHAHRQRTKQIECLKEQVNGVVEEIKDLRYSVHFVAGGNDFHLKIDLPPGFPKDAPVVLVHPPYAHAWLDTEGSVVGCPALKNYSLHENMGKVIKQILDELTSSPPQLRMQAPLQNSSVPSGAPYPMPVDFPVAFSTLPMNSFEARRPPPPPPGRKKYQPPPVPDSFPELENKSNEELQGLLGDEGVVTVNQIVEKHPVMEKLRVDREALMVEIESQAEVNLRHEPELQEGYEQLQRKYVELGDLKSRFDRLYTVQNEKLARCAPANAVAKLTKLSAEAETNAEKRGEAFLEGEVSVTEFTKSFKQQQKLHHIRQAKASMLSDLPKRPQPKPWSP